MKIAFPTREDKGLASPVYGHFGSAPLFVVVESDTDRFTVGENKDADHDHGKCQPFKALGNLTVDAVAVGGIGKGALIKLNDQGVRVYRAVEGTVEDNLRLMKSGTLPEFTPELTCAGHAGGECAH